MFVVVCSFTWVRCTPLIKVNQATFAWSFRQINEVQSQYFVNSTKKRTLVPHTDNKLERNYRDT